MQSSKYPAIVFAGIAFAFSLSVIAAVTWFGDGKNTLHTSAQAWAFTTVLVILAGYGFGAVVTQFRGVAQSGSASGS